MAIQHVSHTQGRWGLALFLGRGFAAWMQAWLQATPIHDKESAYPEPFGNEGSVPVPLPERVQGQMVSALAGMVLDALRTEAA